jgi:hypothetical protein
MVTTFFMILLLRSRIILLPLSVPEASVPEPSVPEQEVYHVTARATPYGSGSATLYLKKVNKQHFANANVQNFIKFCK